MKYSNYIILEIGGKQLWVEKGKYYNVNRIFVPEGKQIWVKRILLASSNSKRFIGQPYLTEAKALVEISEHFRGPKVIVYKMKPKKKYRRKNGYRSDLTKIKIKDIYI